MEKEIPVQSQDQQPGIESEMTPAPVYISENYRAAGKLNGKVALITGGDSGVGRAVAVLYALEGADTALSYLSEHGDAEKTKSHIEKAGCKCLLLPVDLGHESHCVEIVEITVDELGKLDILVNNAAEQHVQQSIEDITEEQLVATFRTNIFAYFYTCPLAKSHRKRNACQCRGSRSNLDAIYSLDIPARESRRVWPERADETPKPTV